MYHMLCMLPALNDTAMLPSILSSIVLLSTGFLSASVQASSHLISEAHQGIAAHRISDEDQMRQAPVTPATVAKIRAFLDRFVDPGKTPEEQTAFFTDPVEYYNHGIVGKPAILRDVERFVRYWPYRNYRVAEIDYINRDPESERVFVSYTIDFEVANKSRSIKGRANYGALISDLDDAPKIESIKEKVVERKSNASLHD